MTESDNDQDSQQKPPDRMESVRLPMEYFILPLCLSWPTPFFFFGVVVGTLAMITDPVRPQWLWSELNWVDWMGVIVRVILLVGFAGMCRRKEWALWLILIVQVISTLWLWLALGTPGFRKDGLFLFAMSIYNLLIVTACILALWQCSQFKKPVYS